MLSRLIALPLIAGVFGCLYLSLEFSDAYAYGIIPQALLLVVIYILQPQIDWWWYNRNPPKLDIKMIRTLDQFFPFYTKLSQQLKERFQKRLALYIFAHEYIGKDVLEEVPDDIKGVIAAMAVQLTFGHEDYLLTKYERIVIYPFPFLSPQFPRNIHASELFEEDGVVIFAANKLMDGVVKPKQHFNIGLYEFARIYTNSYPDQEYPQFDEFIWGKLEAIGGFTKQDIEKTIGLPEPDAQAIGIGCFFTFPDKFQQLLPNAFDRYQQIFNINPSKPEHPVLVEIKATEAQN
ncbi:MAG: zinc-dependent peptidase [Bacteroidota bacterium]